MVEYGTAASGLRELAWRRQEVFIPRLIFQSGFLEPVFGVGYLQVFLFSPMARQLLHQGPN
jgi:hypothetical protein